MTAAPAPKGWCPTLWSPMPSGDGWLARIKPTACRLSAEAARIIADAASRHGNGHIDLTNRANFQVRGLTPHSAGQLADIIISHRLASPDPWVEAIRNVMASPLGADDPSAQFDSHAAARDIEAMLNDEPALTVLPSKFGVLVDGGGALPLTGVTADIMVRAFEGTLALQLDGGTLVARCPPPALVATVKALALAFVRLSSERSEQPRRVRSLIMSVGEEVVFDASGVTPFAPTSPHASPAPSPIGFVSYPAPAEGAFGVGLPFGRIEADGLRKLAALSERFGDSNLRTTPWRALVFPGVAVADMRSLSDEVTALGLIADAADSRLHIQCCVGAPSCECSSVDVRADASRLAATIETPPGLTIHVSGCVKACAHRGPATLTLVGGDGRYDLIRNGSAGDKPALTGLSIDQAIALLQSVQGQRP